MPPSRRRNALTLPIALLIGVSQLPGGAPPPAPQAPASSAFWQAWGDGRAELSGYDLETPRYGTTRKGQMVLIYVTEDMDRRTWIKDDRGEVPAEQRVTVLKLNQVLKFRTGIYPYSVMTSVFSPVNGEGAERFSPAKISLSAQEWCGHVFHAIWPAGARFRSEVHSYFSSEGDATEEIAAGENALYEDALLIQLRELDGPFAGGADWSGALVPSLWAKRKEHAPLRPVPATVRRTAAARDGVAVNRFVLAYPGTTRTFDVEQAAPHRILGWSGADGETATLRKTARLAYWKLNAPGGEEHLRDIGLDLERD
jgi:hypothetical protein